MRLLLALQALMRYAAEDHAYSVQQRPRHHVAHGRQRSLLPDEWQGRMGGSISQSFVCWQIQQHTVARGGTAAWDGTFAEASSMSTGRMLGAWAPLLVAPDEAMAQGVI